MAQRKRKGRAPVISPTMRRGTFRLRDGRSIVVTMPMRLDAQQKYDAATAIAIVARDLVAEADRDVGLSVQFAAGDRVRLLRCPTGQNADLVGKVGIVTESVESVHGSTWVKIGNAEACVSSADLEPSNGGS